MKITLQELQNAILDNAQRAEMRGQKLEAVYVGQEEARSIEVGLRDRRLYDPIVAIPHNPDSPWLELMGFPIHRVTTRAHLQFAFSLYT